MEFNEVGSQEKGGQGGRHSTLYIEHRELTWVARQVRSFIFPEENRGYYMKEHDHEVCHHR